MAVVEMAEKEEREDQTIYNKTSVFTRSCQAPAKRYGLPR